MSFSMRSFIILSVVCALCVSGCKRSGNTVESKEKWVEVATVTERQFNDKVHISGNLKAISQVAVFPKASGKLLRYLVSEGNGVKKGDVIAEIDRDVTGFKYEPLKVTSDIDGIVLELPLDIGQEVLPSTIVAYVGALSGLELNAYVSEKDISKIKKGQTGVLFAPQLGKQINGRVLMVSRMVDPLFHNARVKLRVDSKIEGLLPGMFVRGDIIVGAHSGLAIPEDAVIRISGTNSTYCLVVDDKEVVRQRMISLGKREDNFVEILSGLSSGEKVIVSGYGKIRPGDKVNVKME